MLENLTIANSAETYVGTADTNSKFHDRLMKPIPVHNKQSICVKPSNETIQILKKEYKALMQQPSENFTAHPDESNICIWYFLISGLRDTDYEGGFYLGVLIFPVDFPYNPPEIQMISPNGRFQTRTPICMTFTSFHKETWNVSWSVEKIIFGFISFMNSSELTMGSLNTSSERKVELAKNSKKWLHQQCSIFKEIFQIEYKILDKVFSNNIFFYLEKYVVNEPLQSPTRSQRMLSRIVEFTDNYTKNQEFLENITDTEAENILITYFSLNTTTVQINDLGLYHSLYVQEFDSLYSSYSDLEFRDDTSFDENDNNYRYDLSASIDLNSIDET